MKITPFLIIFFAVLGNAFALDLLRPASATNLSSCGLILLTPSPAGSFSNPALATNGLETGFLRFFDLNSLPYYSLQTGHRVNRYGMHLGINHLDHKLYKETLLSFGLNYSRERFAVGSSFKFLNVNTSGYQRILVISSTNGIIWYHGKLTGSAAISNLISEKKSGVHLPITYLTEMSYQLEPWGTFSIGIEKEEDYEFCFKIGSVREVFQYLRLIASYQSEPSRIGFGVNIFHNSYSISYGFLTHQYLGLTNCISIGYEVKNR